MADLRIPLSYLRPPYPFGFADIRKKSFFFFNFTCLLTDFKNKKNCMISREGGRELNGVERWQFLLHLKKNTVVQHLLDFKTKNPSFFPPFLWSEDCRQLIMFFCKEGTTFKHFLRSQHEIKLCCSAINNFTMSCI